MSNIPPERPNETSAQLLDYIADPATRERWSKLPAHLLLNYDPATLMSPRLLAARLDEAGFPISHDTLETLRSRGGGPPYTKFAKAVRYVWGDGLLWALRRLAPLRSSTSDDDVLPPAA